MASAALAPSGSLSKLQIKAFLDIDYRKLWSDGTNPVTVGINPASYAQSQSIRYTPDKAAGGNNPPQIFDLRKIMMQIDGLGPHYLLLLWGTLVFRGRAESLDINCTLFNPDGTPLRAKANANFIGVNMNKKGKASTAAAPKGP